MKRVLNLLVVLGICSYTYGQATTAAVKDTAGASATVAYVNKQVASLSEMGVEARNDSMMISEEVMKLLKDESYRKSIYPPSYEWKDAMTLLHNMEFKRAFWHLFNLYDTDKKNRNLIVNVFCAYDSVLKMDKALLNTFYTYALSDPRICNIKDNKPEIFRPDLLEHWVGNLKEIINDILYYREQQATAKK